MKLTNIFKQLSVTLLMCALACSIVSCDHNRTMETDTDTEKTAKETTEEATTKTEAKDEYIPDIELKQLCFYSYTEYQKFLTLGIMSDSFVKYEDISMFGEFGGIVFISDAVNEQDFSKYMYNLTLGEDISFALYIYENGKDNVAMDSITNVNTNDLRTLGSDIRGVYTAGGFEYRYASGKLYSITWANNGISYSLFTSDFALSEYEFKENDVISKLLRSEQDDLAEIAIFKDAVAEK